MFGATTNRAAAYSRVGIETGVPAASPHQLILMLFDGAILALSSATAALERNDLPAKGQALSKAIEIIANGLDAGLDVEAGGEIAVRLASLYEYMTHRLLYANLHNSREAIAEVVDLLNGLRDSWRAIGPEVER